MNNKDPIEILNRNIKQDHKILEALAGKKLKETYEEAQKRWETEANQATQEANRELSAVVQECRIQKCNSRNPDGSCREATININTLAMCSKINTKEPHSKTGNIENNQEFHT